MKKHIELGCYGGTGCLLTFGPLVNAVLHRIQNHVDGHTSHSVDLSLMKKMQENI